VARRKSGSTPSRLLLIALAIAVVASAWINRQRIAAWVHDHRNSAIAVATVAAEPSQSANEGRIRVAGRIEVASPPHDRELGITAANAAVLWRKVEMYQWHEHCAGDACTYEAAWSEQSIDSHAFRHGAGHENPPPRLKGARFAAEGIRVGTYAVAADLVVAQVPPIDLPVRAAELPPNLAVSFSDAGGALYAGGDPAHPKVGEIRVSYRAVPLADVELAGVRHGHSIAAE
jgi:hypothetical protein